LPKKLFVTSHAAYRWAQRIQRNVLRPGQKRLTAGQHYRAVDQVKRAYDDSIRIPARVYARLRGGNHKRWTFKKKATYHMTTRALMVVQSGKVITVVRWSMDDFVSVLVHELFGIWPEECSNYANRS
jgi:uncharacterized SAM-dependent methyltransferase